MDPAEMMELAMKIVGSSHPQHSERDDLVQEVAFAIWKAEPKYDSTRGASLDAYLWNVGRYAIKDYRRKWHGSYKQYRNGKERINTVPYNHPLYEDLEWLPATGTEFPNYSCDYDDVLNSEKPRNRAIIYEHCVLGLSEREVGEAYGVQESRVCQIVQRFRQRCSVVASSKSSQPRPMVTPSYKLRKCSPSHRKQSRPIAETSFLNSVLETSLTPSQWDFT